MCTVSIVPAGGTVRLLCNRDERQTRPDAQAPVACRVGDRTAMFPVDPSSGGTWIGINDRGLALTLLNRSRTNVAPNLPHVSRGLIIPPLLGCAHLDELLHRALIIDPRRFAPFRLVAIHASAVVVVTSDARALSWARAHLDSPLLFTSSTLGDHYVEAPRRDLFRRMVLDAPEELRHRAQRRFHQHRWPDRPEVSVLMRRLDARTVSRTTVDLTGDNASLRYRPISRVH